MAKVERYGTIASWSDSNASIESTESDEHVYDVNGWNNNYTPTEDNGGGGGYTPTEDLTPKKKSFTPVVGWLICIDGPCIGEDFRLKSGFNYLGRDESMDINIQDSKVSREGMVKVDYDPETKTFGVGPCEGAKNLGYLNGKPIRGTKDLNAHDKIKVGDSVLMFIPLCGEEFSWDEKKIREIIAKRDEIRGEQTFNDPARPYNPSGETDDIF